MQEYVNHERVYIVQRCLKEGKIQGQRERPREKNESGHVPPRPAAVSSHVSSSSLFAHHMFVDGWTPKLISGSAIIRLGH